MKKHRGTTAAEFIAELANDPEFQRRTAEREAEWHRRAVALAEAEQPIVAGPRDAGCVVSSVWDLVNTSEPYPEALPVLVEHLQRGGYPDRVMESLGRALAVRPAVTYWHTFMDHYRRASGYAEKTGLAVALTATATPAQLDDLLGLINDDRNGDTRIFFLGAVKRVGGQQGKATLQSLKRDPILGKEATALMRSRKST